jgi:REP element-mobilizing transposase RayT
MSDPFVTPCTDRIVIPDWLRGFDVLHQEEERAGDGYRRGLPHWRYAGASYFLTFRLGDSLPAGVVESGQRAAALWEESLEAERLASGGQLSEATRLADRDFRRKAWVKMESLLDGGEGACLMRDPMVRRIVRKGLLHFEGKRCHLAAFVTMPNHIHVLCQPWEGWALENLVGSWKKHTARQINQWLGQSGPLWQRETYDRIIRDGDHFRRVVCYISRNPAKAGLREGEAEVWINPALLRSDSTT